MASPDIDDGHVLRAPEKPGKTPRALARMRWWIAGHAVDDFYQGMVPAMLPFLAIARGYDYTAVAALAMAAALGSALPQPMFGILADRRPTPFVAPVGLTIAGVGACAAVTVPQYPVVWTLMLVSGLGVAAFHPAAGRDARRSAGASATAMSYFATGGKVGFFLAPLVVTPVAAHFGVEALVALVVPALVMGAALLRHQRHVQTNGGAAPTSSGRDRWRPFVTLTGVEIVRSTVSFGISTFLALYFIHHLGTSVTTGGLALTLFLGGGIAGTVIGGRIADRFGAVRTVQIGGALIIPVLVALRAAEQPVPALVLALMAGAAINIPFAVMVKLGQDYLPSRPGTAAGVTLGLAVSAGGLLMPALGAIADHAGITATLSTLCVVSAIAVALALALPRS
ncbi:MFS transporter [uncultured Williamsia sp.]|uniref:MFS transporter n=1 Tax=uncultured Williamsia sp. TaxID=259311 RepID=UPI002604AA1B|nr:MFS transporter [uncultured Williamsia sp.]